MKEVYDQLARIRLQTIIALVGQSYFNNKTVFDFLSKHNIEPIVAPFRHRFFWDGGIHCITSDLYREGDSDIYINR